MLRTGAICVSLINHSQNGWAEVEGRNGGFFAWMKTSEVEQVGSFSNAESATEPAKRWTLFEAEHLERLGVERLPFQSAGNEGSGDLFGWTLTGWYCRISAAIGAFRRAEREPGELRL